MVRKRQSEGHEVEFGAGERVFGGLFMMIPLGISILVLVHLWTQRGFHEPPLFFKLFGSLIAMSFVLVGLGGMSRAFSGKMKLRRPTLRSRGRRSEPADERQDAPERRSGYRRAACPSCGGAFGKGADVSPSGDLKCGYCGSWFNINA